MGASRIVAVRQAVVTGVQALLTAATETNVSVDYAWTFGSTERERIFTVRPRANHDPASLKAGRTARTERMVFDVVVLVESVGGSPEEADVRALALGTYVEEYFADNKQGLGVSGLTAIWVSGFELNNLANDRGHMSEVTYQITYTARLT